MSLEEDIEQLYTIRQRILNTTFDEGFFKAGRSYLNRGFKGVTEAIEYLERFKEIRDRSHLGEDDDEYVYDGDTGKAFINGEWVVVSSTEWERFQSS